MKKIIFLLLFSISFLNSDSIYNSKCVKSYFGNYHIPTAGSTIVLNFSDGSSLSVPYDIDIIDSLTLNDNKFVYTTVGTIFQRCTPIDNSNYYGMSAYDYNYSLAIYGIFLSSLIAFGLIKAF